MGLPVLAVVLACAVAAPAAEEPEAPVVLVATERVEAAPYRVALPAKVGVLEAAAHRALAFEVPGRLARILGEGARVSEGDVVAELDSALERVQLRQAELRLEDARRELGRVRSLKRTVSEKVVDAAEIARALREAERDVAEEYLGRRSLVAGFAGVMTDVRLDPGEVAQPGVPVARLLSLDLLKLEIGVPGYEIVEVRPSAPVDVTVPALPGEHFAGSVHVVAQAAPEGGHLFQVDVLVPNLDRRLRPGMGARARIVTRALESALVVPLDCMVESRGERVVFFVADGRAHAVPVGAAPLDGEHLVLPATLPYRELVVRGQHDLRDGDAVRVDESVLADRAPVERVPDARLR